MLREAERQRVTTAGITKGGAVPTAHAGPAGSAGLGANTGTCRSLRSRWSLPFEGRRFDELERVS
jgi:hypothetical protein